MDNHDENFPRPHAKDYERPEDRIRQEGEEMDRLPGAARGASNQQLDMGPAGPAQKRQGKEER